MATDVSRFYFEPGKTRRNQTAAMVLSAMDEQIHALLQPVTETVTTLGQIDLDLDLIDEIWKRYLDGEKLTENERRDVTEALRRSRQNVGGLGVRFKRALVLRGNLVSFSAKLRASLKGVWA